MNMIKKNYPTTWGLIEKASAAQTDLSSSWNSFLDSKPFHSHITMYPDGTGTFSASVNWGDADQQNLTEGFQTAVTLAWSVLDSLITETADLFSVQQRLRSPHRPRFFPIADSPESFNQLILEHCIDGVLPPHAWIIEQVQSFSTEGDYSRLDQYRDSIANLTEWENMLSTEKTICVWATPTAPEIDVSKPLELIDFSISPPGPLYDSCEVATFSVKNYKPGDQVIGNPKTYFDLGFESSFTPQSSDDTLPIRLLRALETVKELALHFAIHSDQIPVAKRILEHNPSVAAFNFIDDSSTPWDENHHKLDTLASPKFDIGESFESDTSTLLLLTENGLIKRKIPQASPLRDFGEKGLANEAAIHGAAATWGSSDFLFFPTSERKGEALREIGDGLLVIGNKGVVIQAKARDSNSDTEEKAKSWVNKQVRRASAQVDGTVRRLRAQKTKLQNGRGRPLLLDSPSIDWVGVVIIEHSNVPNRFALDSHKSQTPTVPLVRRDWEFLFNQLRSTYAVINYLHRVAGTSNTIGSEYLRYFELALADSETINDSPTPSIHANQIALSVPQLPMESAGHENDESHSVVRNIIEDIANSPFKKDELEAVQIILGEIDALPVGHRTDLGNLLINELQSSKLHPSRSVHWRFRFYLSLMQDTTLVFGVCSKFSADIQTAFTTRVHLMHHEVCERNNDFTNTRTVGVLLTPREDSLRDWDTSLSAVEGDLGLTEDEIEQYRTLWPSKYHS